MNRLAPVLLLPLLGAACGGATAATQRGPQLAPSASSVPADPFAVVGPIEQEPLPAGPLRIAPLAEPFPPAPPGVPPPPEPCRAFAERRPAAAPACEGGAAAEAALLAAIERTAAAERDAELAAIEPCAGLPAGMVRALRAELAPVECADAVVQPLLADLPAAIDPALQHALAGLGLAGRLARTVLDGPRLDPPFERARVEELIAGPLHAWFAEQAAAIEDIARAGAKLAYYGRAIVAVEAGMADMRFIDAARAAPIPDEIAGDQELRDAYYGGLEMGLEARKRRGRDAALVGLGQLAYLGVIRDERAERARQLLSRMYGGRPVGALDALLLPPLAPAEPATVPERLAARLPTFYAGLLIAPERAAEPTMLRMLVEKGISPPQRAALRAAALPPAVRALYARARLELGQRYWRRVDFDEAAGLLRELPAAERTPEARLVLALSIALRGGPANAADMMLRAPLAELGIGRVAALDALAAETGGPLRPLAAFDAALVLDIAAPKDAGTGYWLALARRYRDAAAWLPEGAERAQAVERAREAEGTAKAIAPRGAAPEQ